MVGEQDNSVGVTTSSSSSTSVAMSTMMMNYVIERRTGQVDEPQPPQIPLQNLKRKLGDEEVENDFHLKRTPQATNPQVDIIDESGTPKVSPKPSSSEQISNPIGTAESAASPLQSKSNPVPALPNLPALVFQFQSTQIKMGMFTEAKPQILKNASGSESTPFIVGVTTQGNLEFGDRVTAILEAEQELEQHESTFWKYWWVADKLIKWGNNAWFASPKLHDGERHKVTVEFLVGFILHNLKRHVETKMKGSCSTAVITIPFWYNSSQRTQVKNGVRLAGFPHVFLMNEGPAAVFASPLRDQKVSTSHSILVLSENSGQIDASIYSYTSHASSEGKRRLVMIGHSGHYSQVGTGATTLEFVERDAAIVKQICTQALQNIHDKKHNPMGNTSHPAELITISESKNWGPFPEQVGKQFVTAFSNVGMDNENAVVLGAALLSQKPVDIQAIISDKLAYDVLANCDVDASNPVIIEKETSSLCPKDNVTPIRCRLINHTFPRQAQFLGISQLVSKFPVEIFGIRMKRSIPKSKRMTVNLTVNDEGGVEFKDMVYTSTRRNNPTVEKVPVEDYVWEAPFLSLEDLRKVSALLKECPRPQTPNPIDDAKQALLRKCVEVRNKLTEGTLQFKSGLIKDAFVAALESAGAVGRDMNATVAEVQGQMDIVANWSIDMFPKFALDNPGPELIYTD